MDNGIRKSRCPRCGQRDDVIHLCSVAASPSAYRLASALHVALSWHDNPTQGTKKERDLELAGCHEVLKEWIAMPTDAEPNAIRDDAPSPWWPCPECGGVGFRVACTFERGRWATEDKWEPFDPPSGVPTGVHTVAECVDCGAVTDLARHYQWPVIGEFEAE